MDSVTVREVTMVSQAIRNYSKRGDAISVPDLTTLQTATYERFLQLAHQPEARDPHTGLEALLREIYPIESYDGTMFLDYIRYELDEPRYTADECRELRLTYGMPFKIRVRLRRETHPDLPEEDIYLGEFPVLMGGGEFIVNGAERVIVNQLHRSPGVDFSRSEEETDRPLHSARIVPERGSWIEISVNKKDQLEMRIDQSPKMAATTFLRCLDPSVASTENLLSLFYEVADAPVADLHEEDYAASPIVDTETGEILVDTGHRIGSENLAKIQSSTLKTARVIQNPSDALLLNTVAAENLRRFAEEFGIEDEHEQALLKLYTKLRPGNPPQVDKARQLFIEKFFDDSRYRIGRVGRFRINRKFGFEDSVDSNFIRAQDLLRIIQYLLDLRSNRLDPQTEQPVAQVDDIEEIFSSSSYGQSFLMVVIERTAPAAERLQEVRDKIREARALLPPTASEPSIDTRTLRTNTLVLVLQGDGVPQLALRDQARELERALEQMADVRRVELVGLPEEEIHVAVDLRALSQRGIPLGRVVEALEARNVELPSGELEMGGVRSSIRTTGAFDAVPEVAGVYLAAGDAGLPVQLRDVARVDRRLAEPHAEVVTDGVRGVALGVEMMPGRNAIAFGDAVRALLERRQAALPPGLRVHVIADEPTYVRERLELLTGSLLLGLGLVVCLSLLGMGWRSGAVVSITIPLALTVALGFQGLVGVPLHQISIAALVIAIGIVVDESIVVTDNIQRHLDRGAPPRTAAIEGLGEIHLAVLAGAATTVAAFIPLMAMRGDIGDFIRSIPIVVSLMLLGSVLVAHFVTPLLAVLAHRLASGRGTRGLWSRLPLEDLYARSLRRILARPRWVLAGFVAAAAGVVVLVQAVLWPPSFFPDADRRQFLVRFSLPAGSPLSETRAMADAIAARIAADPDVRDWTAFVGEDAPKFYYNEFKGGRDEARGQFVVNTRADVAFDETRAVVERIGADLKANVPGAFIRTRVLKQGYSGGDDIEIYLTGDDLDVLRALSDRIRELVRETPGVRDAWESFGYDGVSLQARIDPARANRLGVSHLDVATALRTAIDGVEATTFREKDEEIGVRVRLAAHQRRDAADLAALPLWSPAAARPVPLAQVASLEPGFSLKSILRYNRKREAFVRADLAAEASLVATTRDVERRVREAVHLPPGYEVIFTGQRQEVERSFLSLLKAAVVAVFLIYIILVVRFGSLAQPMLILLAVPMSLMGASIGLAVTGNPFSFMAFLGMISLTGIAVNDSIVMVDTINRHRGEGVALREAVARGARTRLRAVAMTSITTIGGLLPLSLGGGAFWAPFGFSMIFGLAAATLLTLGVLPASYTLLEGRREVLTAGRSAAAGFEGP